MSSASDLSSSGSGVDESGEVGNVTAGIAGAADFVRDLLLFFRRIIDPTKPDPFVDPPGRKALLRTTSLGSAYV